MSIFHPKRDTNNYPKLNPNTYLTLSAEPQVTTGVTRTPNTSPHRCSCRTTTCNGLPFDAWYVVGDGSPVQLCAPGLARLIEMGMPVRRLPEWQARAVEHRLPAKVMAA